MDFKSPTSRCYGDSSAYASDFVELVFSLSHYPLNPPLQKGEEIDCHAGITVTVISKSGATHFVKDKKLSEE